MIIFWFMTVSRIWFGYCRVVCLQKIALFIAYSQVSLFTFSLLRLSFLVKYSLTVVLLQHVFHRFLNFLLLVTTIRLAETFSIHFCEIFCCAATHLHNRLGILPYYGQYFNLLLVWTSGSGTYDNNILKSYLGGPFLVQ